MGVHAICSWYAWSCGFRFSVLQRMEHIERSIRFVGRGRRRRSAAPFRRVVSTRRARGSLIIIIIHAFIVRSRAQCCIVQSYTDISVFVMCKAVHTGLWPKDTLDGYLGGVGPLRNGQEYHFVDTFCDASRVCGTLRASGRGILGAFLRRKCKLSAPC